MTTGRRVVPPEDARGRYTLLCAEIAFQDGLWSQRLNRLFLIQGGLLVLASQILDDSRGALLLVGAAGAAAGLYTAAVLARHRVFLDIRWAHLIVLERDHPEFGTVDRRSAVPRR